ncbi:gamma-glutamyltranspeptidase [Neoasaia chiangmaiensis NBRC 101099]|uniref:Gamma-glutamyltransferase n=1 Tax=Neoasaia chiangmaiensis TaxID=320497 RepID=A0A1U9KMG3_9PROT|nr:gamma-glutamyltransferase family protein [Neoasaia chiangmaiensis]AQS86973.1 gamma-glutamyltransferase [Neoasaia chiangmaiensis]GBR37728.1 gamma-glutamyltranspeptidase [Neoasaia chiangmaiensis NBRC 101099]GEN15091.1 gamma-glutamyltranspeptidase [Neoasaia chiangmaiensis]
MLHSARAKHGMVTAPHHLAAQTGRDILKSGGSAIDAAIGVAATLAVVYPHMTGIGGDGFWLIRRPDGQVTAIDACGRAARAAEVELYRGRDAIPWHGGLAANTVAGTVSGWQAAHHIGGRQPIARLLDDAIHYAEDGVIATESLAGLAARHAGDLRHIPGFATLFLPDGAPIATGEVLRNTALANTLRRLAAAGLSDFYTGSLAADIARDLHTAGSPVDVNDLEAHTATVGTPLSVQLGCGRFYNTRPPTQGAASLLILALAERWGVRGADTTEDLHKWVEATKRAFLYRDATIADPAIMMSDPQDLLQDPSALDTMAAAFDPDRATPWPRPSHGGDTTWFGVVDAQGWAVSAIQSLYFEFGSGVTLPNTGIVWQNRGASFDLSNHGLRRLAPGRKPFHTLNPALAELRDGSIMTYGTMGGEGQPQTQAAIVARAVIAGMSLQHAITAPRWLLGRTWGEATTTLKLEDRFPGDIVDALRTMGHDVEILPAFADAMGHAGAIRRYGDGTLEGACDPRSDGTVAAW